MRVLVLGTGPAQQDAIQYCKQQHHDVFAVSNIKLTNNALPLDGFSEIDICDSGKVLEYAKANRINLVLSMGSDVALPTMVDISQKLELPCLVTEQQVGLLTHKIKFREFLKNQNISNLEYYAAKASEDLSDWDIFPALLKPADSQGQRGICYVNNQNDIQQYFQHSMQYSTIGEVIIEQFIEGREVSINGFLQEGQLQYGFFSDRMIVSGIGVGLVQEHRLPCTAPTDKQAQMLSILSSIAQKLEITEGPIYGQFIWRDSDVHVIEVTPRLDGCHLWRLIKEAYGVDLLERSFLSLINQTHMIANRPGLLKLPKDGTLSLQYYTAKPNQVFTKPTMQHGHAIHEVFYYQEGDLIRPVNGYLEKIGYAICQF